jgi:hypothetical protein
MPFGLLRSKGLIDLYATGGNGGSLSILLNTYIPFQYLKKEIDNHKTLSHYKINIKQKTLHCELFRERQ